jgi:hypothetical protein
MAAGLLAILAAAEAGIAAATAQVVICQRHAHRYYAADLPLEADSETELKSFSVKQFCVLT